MFFKIQRTSQVRRGLIRTHLLTSLVLIHYLKITCDIGHSPTSNRRSMLLHSDYVFFWFLTFRTKRQFNSNALVGIFFSVSFHKTLAQLLKCSIKCLIKKKMTTDAEKKKQRVKIHMNELCPAALAKPFLFNFSLISSTKSHFPIAA